MTKPQMWGMRHFCLLPEKMGMANVVPPGLPLGTKELHITMCSSQQKVSVLPFSPFVMSQLKLCCCLTLEKARPLFVAGEMWFVQLWGAAVVPATCVNVALSLSNS